MDNFLDYLIKKVNGMPFMEYDITMCYGIGCGKKDNCHRYLMKEQYIQDFRKGKPIDANFISGEDGENNCELYWEEI